MEHVYDVLFTLKKHECILGGGFWQGFLFARIGAKI